MSFSENVLADLNELPGYFLSHLPPSDLLLWDLYKPAPSSKPHTWKKVRIFLREAVHTVTQHPMENVFNGLENPNEQRHHWRQHVCLSQYLNWRMLKTPQNWFAGDAHSVFLQCIKLPNFKIVGGMHKHPQQTPRRISFTERKAKVPVSQLWC